jgi:hypothetical protein
MSSRILRTTAAAAGIAALGLGLGGTAFAAPEVPAAPVPGSAPAAPDTLTGPASAPAAVPDLPDLFTFEFPGVNTAAPAATDTRAVGGDNDIDPPSTDPQSYVGQTSVGQREVGALR